MRHLHGVGDNLGSRQHQRKQKFVPCKDKSEDGRCKQAAFAHGNDHFPKHLPVGTAVHQGGLLEGTGNVLDVAAHHPNDVGQIESGVEQDHANVGVYPAQEHIQQENRKHHRNGWHHALRDDPVGQMVATGFKTSKAVGAKCAQRHGQHGGDG